MSLLSPSLEAFLAIAQLKTVHGAARQLHMTQTAITQRIRGLESRLRTTLFIRSRRGMNLTSEGEALLRYCLAARDIEGKTLAAIQGAGIDTSARICISGPTSIMSSRVMPSCYEVMRLFPSLYMQFDVNDSLAYLAKSLRAGDCQFAILQHEHIATEMQFKELAPEHYVLVCCPKWRNRNLRDIIKTESIIDFDPTDEITFHYLKQYHLLQYANRERHYVNRTDALADMISKGLGYSVLTLEFAHHYVKEKKLCILNNNKTYENRIALAWYDRPEPPKYFQAVIDAVK